MSRRTAQRMQRLLFRSLICLSLSLPVMAASPQWDEVNAALKRGDFDTALKLLRPMADDGNADAQYALGMMYENGQGVKRDHNEAMNLLQKAAQQGNQDAALYLSDAHEH
jgi:TPR repeat protein